MAHSTGRAFHTAYTHMMPWPQIPSVSLSWELLCALLSPLCVGEERMCNCLPACHPPPAPALKFLRDG